ncbi:MAG: sigma 54-interacting transcriptional regulator [Desulfatirhabdiaceae bacterium]
MSTPAILIVEDEAIVSEDIANKLRKIGYEIAGTTDTGEEAIEIACRQHPSLVLMDVRLAGAMDGIAAADAIRRMCQIPVVFLTAHSDSATIHRAKQAEVFGYILKPFDDRELCTQIEMALYKHLAELRLRQSEERFRSVIENIPSVAVRGCGPDCITRYWNQASERLYGYSAQEAMGRNVMDLIIPPEMRADVEQAIQQMVMTGQPVASSELSLLHRNGTRVTVFSSHAVVQVPGQAPELFCMDVDLTERKNLEEALQKSHDKLEQQVADRTAMLLIALEEAEKRKQIAETALVEIEKLKNQLEAERAYLVDEIQLENNYENIVGQSDSLKYVLYKVNQIAASDTPVLVLGETGTGKELVARAIHALSSRKNRALVKVNCASLPQNIIESELFGHEKGAFTDAKSRRLGRFEVAHGTTLFLDEIGELPLELQSKLLRVLQDGEFERLGSSHTIKVDVRIIAATNRNLEEECRKGRFRKDLWYRLDVFPITVPPLRDRIEDIPLLVDFYVKKISKRMGKDIEMIPAGVMRALQDYTWPGNIRELENVLERAVIDSPGPKLRLIEELKNPLTRVSPPQKTLQAVERDYILQTLEKTRWKVGGKNSAAEILGLDRGTLRARMRKLGIRKP